MFTKGAKNMNTSLQSYIIKPYFVDVLANALLLQNYGDLSEALLIHELPMNARNLHEHVNIYIYIVLYIYIVFG